MGSQVNLSRRKSQSSLYPQSIHTAESTLMNTTLGLFSFLSPTFQY